MAQKTLFGRILWGSLGITALAAPVCAAICPRGRGFCPYPGKCFLYVDHNSLCDYTRTAVTPTPQAIAPVVHTPTLAPTVSPAHCAGKSASKRECYLCGRCTAACRVNGAREYGKR